MTCMIKTSTVDENKTQAGLYAEARRDAANAVSR